MNQKITYKQLGLAFSTALLLSACGGGDNDSSNSSITHNGTRYNTVKSPYTGRIWLDRNLGAKHACQSPNDYQCYGDYYQFGRPADGHQKVERNANGNITYKSPVTKKRAQYVDQAGSNFILPVTSYDSSESFLTSNSTVDLTELWSKTDGSSVCPKGFRVPYMYEFDAEFIVDGSSVEASNGNDIFKTFLTLPQAGKRANGHYIAKPGEILRVTERGYYWSLSYHETLIFTSTEIRSFQYEMTLGASVRCIQGED